MKTTKQTIQEEALELATRIHEAHKNSFWAQQFLLQELRAELERLDREHNEASYPCDEAEGA